MLKHLKHKEINKENWDRCINESDNGLIYAISWFLDIVSPGWEGLVLEEEGIYKAVFPLTLRKKYRISYLFLPPFTQQLGLYALPSVDKGKLTAEALNYVADKFRYGSIPLNHKLTINENQVAKLGFNYSKGITYLLNLNPPYEQIFKNYSEKQRNTVRKSLKSAQEVKPEPSALDELIAMYRSEKGKELLDVKDNTYHVLKELFELGYKKNSALLFTARGVKGNLLGGAVYLIFKKQLYYIFAGSTTEGKKNGAMPLVMDACIRHFAGSEFVLDFEGSKIESLARFFRSFGAEPVYFHNLSFNNLPFPLKLIKK